jgi:hypothetical protein
VTAAEGWPTGAGYVCFDTTALIHSAATGYLAELGSWFPRGAFTARHIMEVEVGRAAKAHPSNLAVPQASWLQAVPVEDPVDLFQLAWLLDHHWKSPPGKDRGEAEVITLCRRYRWTAIMDDERGRAYAQRPVVPSSPADPNLTVIEPRIPTAMLLTTIITATAWGAIAPTKAWRMHCAVDKSRGGFSLIRYGDSQRPIFDACVSQFGKLRQQRPDLGFPEALVTPGLDGLVARIRKDFRAQG